MGFEAQYKPEQITLFNTHNTRLTTDRAVAHALSYHDYEGLAGKDRAGNICVVAGALNDEENELLIVPLQWPMASAQLAAAACGPLQRSPRINPTDHARIAALAALGDGAFAPLPPPVHIDDWGAKIREYEQTVGDLVQQEAHHSTRLPLGVAAYTFEPRWGHWSTHHHLHTLKAADGRCNTRTSVFGCLTIRAGDDVTPPKAVR